MYENSIVPATHPGGGGFCVMKFTLENLYDLHEYCYNWWTNSNDNLPLCRYMGLKLKCYQSENVDWVIKYSTQLPGTSNKLTYPACHPSMLLMSSNKVIIPSKKTQKLRKPYKIIKIHPPAQFTSQWYFQQDIAKKTLVTIHASMCSLDHYYLGTDWDSNNITIKTLNTELIQNKNFTKVDTSWPYKKHGTYNQYFWYYRGTQNPNNSQEFLLKQLIPLQQTKWFSAGRDLEEHLQKGGTKETYQTNYYNYWGNPFIQEYIDTPDAWYTSIYSAETVMNIWKTKTTNFENTKVKEITITGSTTFSLTHLNEPIVWTTRYNPLKDNGQSTEMYLLPTNKDQPGWERPPDDKLILTGFPLWLNIFGFVDFQKRLNTYIDIDTTYVLCFKNTTTIPKITKTFVVLDDNFLSDKSPYSTKVEPSDSTKWYPQLQYQTNSINNIAKCGPGIPKIGNRQSEEAKIKYDFYFKWGGAPPKMITVDNPLNQEIFPIPRNEHETPSLQGPTQAFETLLYTFDQRNYQLTKQAIERITKDWGTKELMSSITDSTRTPEAHQTLQTLLQQAQTQEKEKTEILQQLQQQRVEQQQLQLRILNLIQNMET